MLRLDECENCDKTLDPGLKCLRLAKAVRQTVVLQQELLGLRAAPGARALAGREAQAATPEAKAAREETPEILEREDHRDRDRDRDNLRDRDDTYDYDERPYDQVIASIREEFKIPAKSSPEKRVRSAVLPDTILEPHVTALAGAQATAPFRRERGPP